MQPGHCEEPPDSGRGRREMQRTADRNYALPQTQEQAQSCAVTELHASQVQEKVTAGLGERSQAPGQAGPGTVAMSSSPRRVMKISWPCEWISQVSRLSVPPGCGP